MRGKVVKIRRATVEDSERISELLRKVALQFIVDEFHGTGRARYLQELAVLRKYWIRRVLTPLRGLRRPVA
jgi:hypothetical protein